MTDVAREPSAGNEIPGKPILVPLMLVSLSVILWEIILTRIYSVVLFYHYAFMAVSIAMFGLTFGAILVFLSDRVFAKRVSQPDMAFLALGFGLVQAVVIAVQLAVPLEFKDGAASPSYLIRTFILSSFPFIPAGAFITVALVHSPRTGVAYAYDLLGAGIACLATPALLALFGGPGAVIVSAAFPCLAAFLLFRGRNLAGSIASGVAALALAGFAVANISQEWLRIRWWHFGRMEIPYYEKWNSFSRIMINPISEEPRGWGIDPSVKAALPTVRQMKLEIDSGAGTYLTEFDGMTEKVRHLKYDVTCVAHYLRSYADVFVIGVGGGRDVLTALAFQQKKVTGVEVNPLIVQTLTGRFAQFTGHLTDRPNVRIIADEGRSYLERNPERYDIIQASLVDTVAATAAGAFAFTENGLYTQEAWRLFFDRLKPNGILSFSRWYYGSATWAVEIYRLMALASAALKDRGVTDPAAHIILVRTLGVRENEGVGTLLVSPSPFSRDDVMTLESACREIGCEIGFSFEKSLDPQFEKIIAAPSDQALNAQFPLDITPPTDNRPFFFFHARLSDVWERSDGAPFGRSYFNLLAVRRLVLLLGASLALSAALVFLPLVTMRSAAASSFPKVTGFAAHSAYFALIGLSFMFVEIGLIQRFSLFLGHPTYGFTVVLFGLFLATAVGSALSDSIRERFPQRGGSVVLMACAVALLVADALSRVAATRFIGATTPVRLLLSFLIIFYSGFFMGQWFPFGMRSIKERQDPRGAWYWAVNGALSIVGSVMAMILSLHAGIQTTILAGVVLYVIAAGMMLARPAIR